LGGNEKPESVGFWVSDAAAVYSLSLGLVGGGNATLAAIRNASRLAFASSPPYNTFLIILVN
jgi:hypothetical protein